MSNVGSRKLTVVVGNHYYGISGFDYYFIMLGVDNAGIYSFPPVRDADQCRFETIGAICLHGPVK